MNWNFNVSIISTIVVIFVLMLFYRNREEDEGYLGLKLVGYYILGTFNLKIGILIPIGFIIWLLLFHPKTNQTIKRYSAIFGLLMMLIGYWIH